MDISQAGLNVLEAREACELYAYKDVRGIWTIGVGHTAAAGQPYPVAGMTITKEEADQLFHKDLAPIIVEVNKCGVMGQNQFDAVVSLIYNIGIPAFRISTVKRMLIAKNYAAAGRAMLMWNRPTSIHSRREGEYVQYMHGEYVARINEENV